MRNIPELSGIVVGVDEKKRIIKFQYKDESGKSKVEEFKVPSDDLWEMLYYLSKQMTIEYKNDEPYPIIRRMKANMPMVIYGFNGDLKDKLSKKGEFMRFTIRNLSVLAYTFQFMTFSEADLILYGIVIGILLILVIYYIIIVPLLVLLLSILTLGEAWTMMRRTIFLMPADTGDEALCKKIQEVIRIVLSNKSGIDGIPGKCISEEIASYVKKFLSIHKTFWKGISLQALAIIIFGILLGLTKFTSWIPHDVYFYSEIVLGVFFAIGFFLSILGGLQRKFIEISPKLRFM